MGQAQAYTEEPRINNGAETMPMNNEERAEHAAFACDAYSNSKEGNPSHDEPSTIASDLICDLLHMIRAHGDDPAQKLCAAITNFVAEELDEDGACLDPDIAPFVDSLHDTHPRTAENDTQIIIDVAACIDAQAMTIDTTKMKEARDHIEDTLHGYIGDYLGDMLGQADCGYQPETEE